MVRSNSILETRSRWWPELKVLRFPPTLTNSPTSLLLMPVYEGTECVMAAIDTEMLDQLPDEMFTIIKSASNNLGPRLARLSLVGRNAIDTPHYLGNTSRGVVPHITPDVFARDTAITGVYAALEDCKCLLPMRNTIR
jgi:hypothetical protein